MLTSAPEASTSTSTPSEHDDTNPWLLEDPDAEIATARATLRLYVYDVAALLPTHAFTQVDCQNQFHLTYQLEWMLPAALQRNMRVVTDPSQANLFLVPHNGTCYTIAHMRQHKFPDIISAGRNTSAMYLDPILRGVVERFPYYNASGGRDHVYVFTFDEGVRLFSRYVYNVTASGIRLQSYGDTGSDSHLGGIELSRPSDIIVPAPVPLTLAADVRPSADRGMLAFFAGEVMKDVFRYSRGVRPALIESYGNETALGPAPDRIFFHQGHIKNYCPTMANATFALCPRGWAP